MRGEFAQDIHHLTDTLKKLKPKIIVSLGRTPLWALTGLNGITAVRGQVLANRLGDAPVIATFHPSFVARQNSIGPETEATFRADLALARQMAG